MNTKGGLDVLKDVRTNAENSLNSTEAGSAILGSNDQASVTAAGPTRVRFDRYVLDDERGCLLAGDEEITLRPKTFEFMRGAVLMQVTTHGMHHRAQCINMLRQLGVKPLPNSSVADWMRSADPNR